MIRNGREPPQEAASVAAALPGSLVPHYAADGRDAEPTDHINRALPAPAGCGG